MILNFDQFWWWTRVTEEHTGLKTLKLLKAKLASHPTSLKGPPSLPKGH